MRGLASLSRLFTILRNQHHRGDWRVMSCMACVSAIACMPALGTAVGGLAASTIFPQRAPPDHLLSFPYTTKPITMRRLLRQRVSPAWLHGWVARMMLPCPEPAHHLYEGQCEILWMDCLLCVLYVLWWHCFHCCILPCFIFYSRPSPVHTSHRSYMED